MNKLQDHEKGKGEKEEVEWDYLGEGNQHLVLKYIGKRVFLKPYVLRLIKTSGDPQKELKTDSFDSSPKESGALSKIEYVNFIEMLYDKNYLTSIDKVQLKGRFSPSVAPFANVKNNESWISYAERTDELNDLFFDYSDNTEMNNTRKIAKVEHKPLISRKIIGNPTPCFLHERQSAYFTKNILPVLEQIAPNINQTQNCVENDTLRYDIERDTFGDGTQTDKDTFINNILSANEQEDGRKIRTTFIHIPVSLSAPALTFIRNLPPPLHSFLELEMYNDIFSLSVRELLGLDEEIIRNILNFVERKRPIERRMKSVNIEVSLAHGSVDLNYASSIFPSENKGSSFCPSKLPPNSNKLETRIDEAHNHSVNISVDSIQQQFNENQKKGTFKTFTVEIKPKGYQKSFSIFYNSKNRKRKIKRTLNRFQLMQYYRYAMQKDKGTKPPWGSMHKLNQKYSPEDIFSLNQSRMKRALRALIENPQNYFHVFVDGVSIFGKGKEDRANFDKLLESLFPSIEKKNQEEFLSELLVKALLQENSKTLLVLLYSLQKYDVIGMEGAILLFGRLLEFLRKSDSPSSLPARSNRYHLRRRKSKFEEDSNIAWHTEIDTLIKSIDFFTLRKEISILNKATDCIFDRIDAKEPESKRVENLKSVVNTFKPEDCLELLRGWLVALSASDVSIMLNFVPIDNDRMTINEPHIKDENPDFRSNKEDIIYLNLNHIRPVGMYSNLNKGDRSLKSCAYSQNINAKRGNKSDMRKFRYHVEVIDWGPKSAKKIVTKSLKEGDLVKTVANFLSNQA